uniref:Uncharacterized protein n=1 Tax=Ananas comosus var. bracteatus TaxID=296719 RepID=A0A6V7PLI5_ANACO|nr:unnamed protein product [Ananas comosus var. bracteatus]
MAGLDTHRAGFCWVPGRDRSGALDDPKSQIDVRLMIGCKFEPNRIACAAGGRLQVSTSNLSRPGTSGSISTLSFHSQGSTQGSPACAAPNGPVVVYTPHGNPLRHPIPHGRATVA